MNSNDVIKGLLGDGDGEKDDEDGEKRGDADGGGGGGADDTGLENGVFEWDGDEADGGGDEMNEDESIREFFDVGMDE